MRRRAACCCDVATPCDALNLLCFQNTIPPKYVRIDGARSINSRDNVLAQDSQGNRCDCVGIPWHTRTLTEIVHLEGPRIFVNDGIYLGYAYQLTGTASLNSLAITYCPDCNVPFPGNPCPAADMARRESFKWRANLTGQLRCTPCNYIPGDLTANAQTYAAFCTARTTYLNELTVRVCCDPPPNTQKFTDRGSSVEPYNLTFQAGPNVNVCNWNGLCAAGLEGFRNAFEPQTICSSFFFPQMETRYSGSIKAVFSTV